MPLQSNDLVMVALGALNDIPPVPEQPVLVNGIHLRWVFPRNRGFPWYGYYLFRRPHEFRGERCLRKELGRLPVGSLDRMAINFDLGRLSSDVNLSTTDDFSDSGGSEFDLAGRAWLRVDFSRTDLAYRVDLKIGCRGETDQNLTCIDLSTIKPGRVSNPLRIDEFAFLLAPSRKRPPKSLNFVEGAQRARRVPGGIELSGEMEVRVRKSTRIVEVTATLFEGVATFQAITEDGTIVASARFKKQSDPQPQRLRLVADTEFSRCRIVVRRGRLVIHRFCYARPSMGNVRIDVVALDGDVVVASATAHGVSGTVVPVTLQADRITAVRIGSGPAALIDLCVRPIALGIYEDWQAVPNCPEPLTLPIIHDDYPAQRGTEDLLASRNQAGDRIVYGPREPWEAEFKELYGEIRALVVGGPPGPASRAMAHPARAATNVGGVPGHPLPNVPNPHLASLHPLDLILLGALHPPIAQMIGLYWADRTANPNGVYDYLIVADHAGIGGESGKEVLSRLSRNWHRVDGWICFARQAQPAPGLVPPSGLRAYALPGATFRANGPAGDQAADCAGNVGLTWPIDRDDLGFLKPGAAIFHHVWRDRQGNGNTPSASVDATELATKDSPVLVSRPAGIPTEPPKYPGDWPQFGLNFVDFALQEGWYGYKVNAIDIFGRFSPKSPFAEWRQWAPAPDPKPWYYVEPPQDRQVHASSVRVIDTEPPPPPMAVEAWALDPTDPMTLQDQAYLAWRAGLPQNVRNTLIGLRVRWRWTVAQQRQAPDTVEFRVYWHPGTNPPAAQRVSADGQTRWVLKDISDWDMRCHVCPYGQSFAVEANGDRSYQVFLPVVGTADPFINGVPLNPDRAEPIAYGQVTVTAADDAVRAIDRWPGPGTWSSRSGNESRPASPVRVFRVYRVPPPPPEAVVDSERVYATPADWRGHSFYTFRWKPEPNLKTHVHRAMDEAVFSTDWAKRPRANLDPNDMSRFPDPAAELTWNAAKRAQVAQTLNAFNDLADAGTAKADALMAYRTLSDDALRILASFPENQKSFTQLTIQPLDPEERDDQNRLMHADRRGPDDPANYAPRSVLRCFIDQLDGRATNRYLYRASYVDQAHNRSGLGPVGTPVRLPNVVPPRAPVMTKVVGGERKITLSWASNREPDLLEYRVFRASSAEDTRDLRAMTQVAVVAADPDPAARPAEVVWTDEPVRGLVNYWYRVTAVDRPDTVDPRGGGGNVSPPSTVILGRAQQPIPKAPIVAVPSWDGGHTTVTVTWQTDDPFLVPRVERRLGEGDPWRVAADWLPAGTMVAQDAPPDPGMTYEYRIRVRDHIGQSTFSEPVSTP